MMGLGTSGVELVTRALPADERAGAAVRTALGRWAVLIWGGLAYGLFVSSLTRLIGFLSGLGDRAIDSGPVGGLGAALGGDVLLVLAFGLPLALLGCSTLRCRLAERLPPAAERSTLLALPSAALLLLVEHWQPLPTVVWQVEDPLWRAALWGASAFGWTLALGSTFMLDHFSLFGLRHVWRHFRGLRPRSSGIRARWAYRSVRQPLVGGLLMALWASPTLTAGHLLLAGLLTGLLAVGVGLEECRRRSELWEAYREQSPVFPRRR